MKITEQNKLRRDYWRPFWFLLIVGLLYLSGSIVFKWKLLEEAAYKEVNYLNQIFSDTVSTTFDQHSITLLITGERIASRLDAYNKAMFTSMLDGVIANNRQLADLSYFDTLGNILVGHSAYNTIATPNVLNHSKTRTSFQAALGSDKMVMGQTHYQDQLGEWIIPISRSIFQDGVRVGVMTGGLKPDQLVPDLQKIEEADKQRNFIFSLIHDTPFISAFVSGIKNHQEVEQQYTTEFPDEMVQYHFGQIQKNSGMSAEAFKQNEAYTHYTGPDETGELRLLSVHYIGKYRMWSVVSLGLSYLYKEMLITCTLYIATFVAAFVVIFLLFRRNYHSIRKNDMALRHQANHDSLTGLHNRQYLYSIEPAWIALAQAFSVIFLDLNNFKMINDSHGHDTGDRILKLLSHRLKHSMSAESVLCRPGGDEFIILHKADEAATEALVRELVVANSQPYVIDSFVFIIKASIGISQFPRDGATFKTLFSAADNAMFISKRNKLDYCMYSSQLADQQLRAYNIEQSLHHALPRDELYVVYQPQYDINGNITGTEALARWRSAELGDISPEQFIPAAESCGLIVDIGRFILQRSIADISACQLPSHKNPVRLSVNVSLRQLEYSGFKADLMQILEQHHFSRNRLTLEITESIFMEDTRHLVDMLIDLKHSGIQISLDDFGTGYSSLSLLRELPLSEIKIDKIFTDGLLKQQSDQLLIKSIIEIAKVLRLSVVAEGVESREQAQKLAAMGCHSMQGYLYSKPLAYKNFLQLINA